MKHLYTLILLCSAGLAMNACAKAKDTLGLTKEAPDEFAVVKRAPLSMPPDYRLRPPRPGAPRPQEQTTSQQAKQVVFGEETQDVRPMPTQTGGNAEAALLSKAGAPKADPNVRQKVDAETELLHDRNKPVAEKLLGIGGDAEQPSASVVDAEKEAERIRENIEAGKPVTEGETPSIEE